MKNILTTILTMGVTFCVTYYVLTNVIDKKDPILDGISNNQTTPTTVDDSTVTNTEESGDSNASTDNEMLPDDLDKFLESYENWKDYYQENINLSADFIPIDIDGEEVEKEFFLTELTSGDYAPVKLSSGDEMYQLYELDENQEQIGDSIKRSANVAYTYFKKEGTKFPEFNFVDLNGTRFSSTSTAGKILIIKLWFINCKVCVEEFPELNKLYDEYEAYEDVIFLSLAFDKAEKLKKFLTKKQFRYPVVADQKVFMTDKIEAKQYPTHLIVDEDGNIEKMVSSFKQLKEALNKIASPDLTEFENESF